MRLRHFLQPLEGQAGQILIDAIRRTGPAEVVLVSAWLKATGMRRLQPHLQALVDRGGSVRIVCGIDQLGTSREGLSTAITVGSDLYVYHDRPAVGAAVGRSFHPKVYWVKRGDEVVVLLGSGNLTAGGLFTNYEWFEHLALDLQQDADRAAMREIERSIERLLAEPATTRRIDGAAGLAELLRVHGGAIPPERRSARERHRLPGEHQTGLFGSRLGLPVAPEVQTEVDDTDLAPAERSRRLRRAAAGRAPVVQTGLRRLIHRISRGRPGQIQLRMRAAEWVLGQRTRATFERSSDGTRKQRPVVATHARGRVNTVRVELEGFDQNVEPSLVVLEQMPDGSIQWQFYRVSSPAARLFVQALPSTVRRTMPAAFQELDASGRWRTVQTLA